MDNKASGIYLIENKVNGSRYIGSAVNIRNRWKNHKNALRNGNHNNAHLQRAWNKYGESAFDFSVLAIVEKTALLTVEQRFIDKIHPKYNISPTAGSNFGVKHRAETRQKIKESHYGIRPNESTRKRLSESHKGQAIPEEQRRKMSESSKGKYRGWADKPVLQFTKSMDFVNQYPSVMAAERATGIGNSKIVRCLKGGRKTTGGFVWRYAETGQTG